MTMRSLKNNTLPTYHWRGKDRVGKKKLEKLKPLALCLRARN